jgi:IS6 family transposase
VLFESQGVFMAVLQKRKLICYSGEKRAKEIPSMSNLNQKPFKWRHFHSEIILLCVRWYLRYALSYRDLEEMMLERGLSVDHTTIYRWVQEYAPEIEKRCRPHLKACNDSWKVDETSIKVKKVWVYLYRAVDSKGNTLEFLLSPSRDAEAAKHFFCKALHVPVGSASQAYPIQEQMAQLMAPTDSPIITSVPRTACSIPQTCLIEEQIAQLTTPADSITAIPVPRVINVDKHAAYPKAIADLKVAGILPASVELRQSKYLNNLIEQDHRFIKRLTKPGMGFFSLETAWRTLQGYEIMNMIRKGQVQGVNKGNSPSQATFIARLFGVVASAEQKREDLSSRVPPPFFATLPGILTRAAI